MPAIVTHVLTVGAIVAGKYRIERILGMGGMGVVAVATHVQLDQQFALKVVHDAMAEDPSIVERFMREARASARLKSEHVCRVSDVDQLESGAPFIVMELLDGQDLQKIVQRQVLPIEIAADYVLQACIAIAEAHGLGIVHRDLKPANLFVATRMDGTPLIKVLDFGIAKAAADAELRITQTQAIMGSPGYMSPEQLRSARDVDGRSDIWSLGVILYELTTGRLPFIGQTITELAVKVAIDPPAPLPATMDPRFAAVVSRCLDKDIERRYQSVNELANDLAQFAGAAGMHSASLIARLSGSQPLVSAARSAVIPQATQLTGFGTRPSGNNLATVPGAPPTMAAPTEHVRKGSKKPLVIIGALVLLGGAAAAGYLMTRTPEPKVAAAKKPHRDAGVEVGLADGGTTFETRELTELRAQKKWREIIDKEKVGSPDDVELKTAVAEARGALGVEMREKVDGAVRAGDCVRATAMATNSKQWIDNADLLASASKCVQKQGVGSGSGSAVHAGSGSGAQAGSGSAKPATPTPATPLSPSDVRQTVESADQALKDQHYDQALALAKKVLADGNPHFGAARAAGVASCGLGRKADAQKYYDAIAPLAPKWRNARSQIVKACATKSIAID